MTDRKLHVTIKGIHKRLVFVFDDSCPFEWLLADLQTLLSQGAGAFLAGVPIPIMLEWGRRHVSEAESEQVIACVEQMRRVQLPASRDALGHALVLAPSRQLVLVERQAIATANRTQRNALPVETVHPRKASTSTTEGRTLSRRAARAWAVSIARSRARLVGGSTPIPLVAAGESLLPISATSVEAPALSSSEPASMRIEDVVQVDQSDVTVQQSMHASFEQETANTGDVSDVHDSKQTSESSGTGPHLIRTRVRAGQTLHVEGDLVLIGDVNPGGFVSSTGSIYILGALLGIAHAGYNGDEHAVIAASKLKPAQLRIGSFTSRPGDEPTPDPRVWMEVAFLREGMMEVDRLDHFQDRLDAEAGDEFVLASTGRSIAHKGTPAFVRLLASHEAHTYLGSSLFEQVHTYGGEKFCVQPEYGVRSGGMEMHGNGLYDSERARFWSSRVAMGGS